MRESHSPGSGHLALSTQRLNMAITAAHYQLLREHAPLFKRGGALLEIGEANWYGDLDQASVLGIDATGTLFDVAKAVYRQLFAPAVVHAVDKNGSPKAMRQDLNRPLQLSRLYDVVINHGTAEHVFNIPQVFKSMHDATATDGYMVHDCPFQGWPDHGFYTLQPTLFYDLAHANDYELVSLSIHSLAGDVIRIESREHLHGLKELPANAQLFVVLKKQRYRPFRIPLQGIYDCRLSEAGKRAWQENR